MNRFNLLSYASGAVLAFAIVGIAPAAAQSAANTKDPAEEAVNNNGNDIIVTATRRNETLQTVPISVTAVTAQNIVSRGITNIDNLASSVPNLAVRPAVATKSSAIITMRGLVQRDNLANLDPSVGVYVDDVYQARSYSALNELLDVERVEVLRGPQGTLFGRNSIGGAIRIITRKPKVDEGLTGTVYGGAGNYGMFEVGGAVTIPIVNDVLAIRYAGNYRKRNGYTHSILVNEPYTGPASIVRTIDTDNEEVTSHRISLAWQPTETTKIDASYYYYQERSNGMLVAGVNGDISRTNPATFATTQFNSPQRNADFYTTLTNSVPFSRASSNIASLTLQQELSDNITLKLVGSYVKGSNHSALNADGFVTDSVTLLQFEPDLLQTVKQYTGELQLLGKAFDGKLDWITGAYYFKETGYEFAGAGARVFGSAASAVRFVGTARNTSKSAFASLTFHATDQLTLRAGGRYTEDTKALDGENRNFVTDICIYTPGVGISTSTTPGGACHILRSDKFKYWIYDLGIDYKITDRIFAYVKTGNGVRGGGQQLRAVDNASSAAFTPDKVVNYEAGLKADIANVLTLNAAVYHVNYSNVQQSKTLSPPVTVTSTTIITNQGDARINGFEIEATLRPVVGLRIDGAYGLTDFKFSNPLIVQVYSPREKFSISGSYTAPIGSAKLTGSVNYDYTGSSFTNEIKGAVGGVIPSYSLLGARLSLALDNGVELAVWGRNLTKEKYNPTLFTTTTVLSGPVGAPRTFGASARFSF